MKYKAFNGFEIEINLKREELITPLGQDMLKARYLLPDEEYGQQAFARAACAFADDEAHAQRLYDYASKHWFMFATPLLCNGGTQRGLPISCFLNYVDDSCEGLAENYAEDIFLSRNGGGIGTYYGAIRSKGEITSKGNETTGVIPFIVAKDAMSRAFQQGSNRRGACAVYLDVSHPEITEFIHVREATRPDGRRAGHIHHGVNISDAFMDAVRYGRSWDLVDPNSGKVRDIVDARSLWREMLIQRVETGEPYFHFIDTSNRDLPESLKIRGLKINTSNLCNEIYLPTNADRTAVCCLSSVNLVKWDDWKNEELFIEDLIRMLDNVLDVFIQNAPPEAWRAVESAKRERSVGLGAMGWHSFLQDRMVAIESPTAMDLNNRIFRHLFTHAKIASGRLADERGEAPDMEGTGLRNAHVMAIAPNASSSDICGEVSPSIEPEGNAYNKKSLEGDVTYHNPRLKKLLQEKGMDTEEIWYSIKHSNQHGLAKGSVQHLKCLTQEEKAVFKTPFEINQLILVEQAAMRQHFLDQGQSFNVFVASDISDAELHKIHWDAWSKGLKGMYYCRSFSKAGAETGGVNLSDLMVDKQEKEEYKEIDTGDECLMCQG